MEEFERNLREALRENIRAYRAELSLSQEALADLCGLHRTYVGAVERGEKNITLGTLARLAKALGVKPLQLLNVRTVNEK